MHSPHVPPCIYHLLAQLSIMLIMCMLLESNMQYVIVYQLLQELENRFHAMGFMQLCSLLFQV